jgi:hypothetical protein
MADIDSTSSDENGSTKIKQELHGSYIFRQDMVSLAPKCTYQFALICNIILCLIFFVAGLPNLLVYNKLNHIKIDYTDW